MKMSSTSKRPRFNLGDRVSFTAKKLKGEVTHIFWADAPGGSPERECYRYYISTSRGLYSVTESEIGIREVKTPMKSGSENHDLTVVKRNNGPPGKEASQ
jgi:hypothetical protein